MLFAIIFACSGGNSGAEPSDDDPTPSTAVVGKVNETSSVTIPSSVQTQPNPLAAHSIERKIYFTNKNNFQTGQGEFLEGVAREFTRQDTAQAAIDQIYKGPSESERGLVLTRCDSTGATLISINDGLAFVQLTGGCAGCGTHSIYDSLRASLIEWPAVSDIVLFASNESIDHDVKAGRRPLCLEP